MEYRNAGIAGLLAHCGISKRIVGLRRRRHRLLRRPIVRAHLQPQSAQHLAEDQLVDRVEAVPVDVSSQSQWIEDRRLSDPATAPHWLHLGLEPRPAGHFHLRAERHETIFLPRLPPAEVERFPSPELPSIRRKITRVWDAEWMGQSVQGILVQL